ncbi:hypothetical protein BDV39DRAFT_184450 [Aspergillus sergii]|uniref:Uncharacterized protein n=1 Tax=Aspergillus sergii TaxID=1034303 RepID=A0A5N6WMP8_9EURO|nr:hypothetical protein BDV39DRAFT_184450 [Aspergillus sergii]
MACCSTAWEALRTKHHYTTTTTTTAIHNIPSAHVDWGAPWLAFFFFLIFDLNHPIFYLSLYFSFSLPDRLLFVGTGGDIQTADRPSGRMYELAFLLASQLQLCPSSEWSEVFICRSRPFFFFSPFSLSLSSHFQGYPFSTC